MIGTDYPENHLPDDDGVNFLSNVTAIISDADIAFARNCNVEFFLPEQFFEGGAFRKFLQRLETDKDDDDDSPPKEETEEEKQKGVPRGD